jgi:hypothetical protein
MIRLCSSNKKIMERKTQCNFTAPDALNEEPALFAVLADLLRREHDITPRTLHRLCKETIPCFSTMFPMIVPSLSRYMFGSRF